MNAASIIDLPERHGVTLTAEARRIIARPSQRLTPDLREAIRRHGADLLTALSHKKQPATSNQDTGSLKGAAEGTGPRSHLPQGPPHDDRRSSYSDAQAEASTDRRVITDPAKPCPAYDSQAKRREALSMLAEHPSLTYAFTSDDQIDPNYVIITLAIRGQATCDLRIPKASYDGFRVLELIGQYTRQ